MADEVLETLPEETSSEEAPVIPGEPENSENPIPASTAITWDEVSRRFYKTGLDHGVLYKYENEQYVNGVPWSGLVDVSISKSGHEKTLLYTNDRRSAILFTPFESGGSIKCITYPDELEECFGYIEVRPGVLATDQDVVPFGFCYRRLIGNDVVGTNAGYELHLIYQSYVTDLKLPTYSTINADNSISNFEISFESIPEDMSASDPMCHIVLDSRRISAEKMQALEAILYGAESSPRMPLPDEIYDLFYVPPEPVEYSGYPSDGVYPTETIYPIDQGE